MTDRQTVKPSKVLVVDDEVAILQTLRYNLEKNGYLVCVAGDGRQALSIAHGFARMVEKSRYRIHACSILPEHVHLVLGRRAYRVEQMVRLLKAEASSRLAAAGRHPLTPYAQRDGSLPSPWARGCWKVYLNSAGDVRRSVSCVERNPLKEGKRPQHWSFVTPYT